MNRLIWIVALTAGLTFQASAQKKRVAVLNFDYGTVRDSVAAIFGTDRDVGRGISDLVVEKLVATGVYSVIERNAIDKIMAEQNFSNSDRVDANSAAKLGRILGVDAIIIGSIVRFGRDDKSTGVAGGAMDRIGGRFGIGGVKRSNSKAVVGLTARMIDTSTAEILGTASGNGESARSGTSLLGAGGGSTVAGANYDMKSKNFASTIIGEAVIQAVGQLSGNLDQNAGRLPTKQVVIDGLVADVSGNTIILNVGSSAGLKVGDKLQVRRKVREVRDPASGKVIRSIEDKLGELVITEVDASSAVGTYTGSSPAKVGDTVKN